ncbi:MAG: sulfur carrier protein ThiS [Oscillospiraceae bacterium]|nr:sulfur carrier protein ThiS [Oscillospiraceae bacterium]
MVSINGELWDAAGKTVAELLKLMNLNPARTAVMIDGTILPKADYGKTLSDGEEVDIVGFVGGG